MKKKFFILVLCLALIAACYGCRGTVASTKSPNTPGSGLQGKDATWQKHTDPIKLTMSSAITVRKDKPTDINPSDGGEDPVSRPIMVGKDKPTDIYPPDWGEDPVSRRILSLTGVQLVLEKQDPDFSLDVLLASGEMTDLICVQREADFYRLENHDVCYGLDELADSYCPDFWDDVDPLERLNNQAADGHIYTLRGGYNNTAVYDDERIPINPPWTMNIRTDKLEKLGASMPTSVEELEALLYRAKDSGIATPYGMYGPAETPLAGWMGVKRDLSWDSASKKVRTPLRDEAWLPYFKMMAKWYRDGIMALPPQEAKIQDGFVTAIRQINAYSGNYYFGTETDNHPEANEDNPFPFALWTEPLTYQGQIRLQAADQAIAEWDDSLGKGWRRYAGTFITRGCSNPERAILFLQFLKSDEGAKLTRWGLEKEHYTLDQNGLLVYNKDCQISNKDLIDMSIHEDVVGRNTGINYWNFVDNSWVAGVLDGSPVAYLTNKKALAMRQAVIQAGISYKKYLAKNKNPVFSFAWPNAGSPDDQKIKAIQARWEEAALAIITQSPDDAAVESAWDKLVTELTSMGLDAMEDNMTVRFVDALKRYQAAGYFTDIQP